MASNSEGSSIAEPLKFPAKNLTCPVCKEIYRTPRILPCFHTFCQVCLKELEETHQCVFPSTCFPCPVCRKDTVVPEDGVTGFQANFYITEAELEQARQGAAATPCPMHATHPVIFFCHECDQPLCMRCKLTTHEKHPTVDFSEAVEQCKKRLGDVRGKLGKTSRHLLGNLKHANQEREEVEKKEIGIAEQVRAQYQKIVTMAANWRDVTLQGVARLSEELSGPLRSEEERLQKKYEPYAQLLDRSRVDELENMSGLEILALEKQLNAALGQLSGVADSDKDLIWEEKSSLRVGLHCDLSSIQDEDIRKFVGEPVVLGFPYYSGPSGLLSKEFRCGGDEEFVEVSAVQPLEDKASTLAVTFGAGPYHTDEHAVHLRDYFVKTDSIDHKIGEFIISQQLVCKQAYLHKYNPLHNNPPPLCVFVPHGHSGFQVGVYDADGHAEKARRALNLPRQSSGDVVSAGFGFASAKVLAFDVSGNGQLIAVVEEKVVEEGEAESTIMSEEEAIPVKSRAEETVTDKRAKVHKRKKRTGRHSTEQQTENHPGTQHKDRDGRRSSDDRACRFEEGKQAAERRKRTSCDTDSVGIMKRVKPVTCFPPQTRVVHLYRKGQSDPVATYTPPEHAFHPTDVRFWKSRTGVRERLFISDWMNDSVHVVGVEENSCCFEHYLAGGHSLLVRPTALGVENNNIKSLWIGCGNGWVLRMPFPFGLHYEQQKA